MSEARAELYAALAKAQAEFEAIVKEKRAKAGSYEFSYASLDAILDKCRPVLAKNGLAVTQILEDGANGPGLRTMLGHSSGQELGGFFTLPGDPGTPQQDGSRQTYYRRYALAALLGVAPEDDDDGGRAAEPKKPAKKKTVAAAGPAVTPPAQALYLSQLLDALEKLDGPPDGYESWRQVAEASAKRSFGPETGLEGLSKEQADELCRRMKEHVEGLELRQGFQDVLDAAAVDEIEF